MKAIYLIKVSHFSRYIAILNYEFLILNELKYKYQILNS